MSSPSRTSRSSALSTRRSITIRLLSSSTVNVVVSSVRPRRLASRLAPYSRYRIVATTNQAITTSAGQDREQEAVGVPGRVDQQQDHTADADGQRDGESLDGGLHHGTNAVRHGLVGRAQRRAGGAVAEGEVHDPRRDDQHEHEGRAGPLDASSRR